MKPLPMRFVMAGLVFLTAQAGLAQAIDGPVGVAVTIRALNLQWGSSGSGYLDLGVDGLNGYQMASAPSYGTETPQLTARLEPGKTYHLSVSSSDLYNLTVQAAPPPGYVMEIERVARERFDLGYGGYASVQIRVLAPMQEYSGRAGTATSLTSGRIFWQVALGSLANGSSAGAIAIIDTGTGSWSSLFTPAGFTYDQTSSEVQVFYNAANVAAPYVPGTIRQIIAPEACADVVVTSSTQAELKFYHHDQMVAGTGLHTFTGDPFAWYLINQDGSQPNRVYINCDVRELPNLTSSGAPVVETKHTVLERTGIAPNFTWTADEWYEGGTTLSRDVRVRNGAGETITVSQPGGATATSRTRTYGSVPWGEEIVAETAGTTDIVTTTNEFYTASAQAGNYGRPRSTITTGGSWEAYEYYDYAAGTADVAGALYRSHRPFLNSDTSVPASLASHNGVVTTYAYALDAFGRRTRPTSVTTTVGGVTTSSSSTSYADATSGFTGHPLLYLVTATSSVSTSSSATLTTVSKYFREDAGANYTYPTDDFFRGQPHSIQQPDGRKQSFVYQRGSWDGTTFTLSANNGTDYGAASRIAVITGTSTATGAYYSSHAGYSIDGLYLVDGKSTMEVTIRDASALVRRTETQVWSSGAWQLVSSVTFGYNYSNLLVSRINFNSGQYEASYSGEHKNWEKDDSGIRVDYTYDAAGRVATATKSSGPTTTFAYDAEHRVLSENVTAAGFGENIYSARTYDDAGRLRTELPVGMNTITYSYNPAARTRTATFPDGGARTETWYADGQLDHVDGSAVVPQYNAYTMESDGRRTAQTYFGSPGSARWQKGTTDWLGRATHAERPGFSVSSQAVNTEDHTYEAGTGRLIKTARTSLAPTRYEYDALGQVNRSGLDIGDDGLVNASADRISESDRSFWKDGNNWWLRQETKTYPKLNDATVVTTSVTRTRLSGHPAGRLDETQVTDAEGNTVTRTVDVDRANAVTTVTTTRPSVVNTQIETITNGLTTSVRGHDGLTSTAQYDALSRAWKNTDSRGNTSTTTYKYGTALVQSVTDGAGNNLGTVSYDGMGRKLWVQDAAGQYTHFAYNLRGQLINQWGGGSYPVSYGYDGTYGDRTSLSTYRYAPAGDSIGWPAVGSPDTTTWTYDGATGLLWKKTDAGSQVTEFDYNVRGQTSSRKWARTLVSNGSVKLTCSYGYDGNTGELLTQTYNDGADPIPTPAVTYGSYSRLGQVGTVADGTGTRTFNYNAFAPWRMDNEALDAGFYASRVITRLYDGASGVGGVYGPYTPGFFTGRYTGYDLGIAGNTARDQHIYYTTSNLARFVGVDTRTTTGAARDYVYNYAGSSALVGGYTMGSFSVTRGYEPQRNVLTSLDSQWNGASQTRYDYTVNALGQRTTAKQGGAAYADYSTGGYSATYNVYNYNARGELETAARYRGDNPTTTPSASDELPARRFEYRYDSIGNRKTAGSTGTAADDGYTANALNQYAAKDNKTVKVLGTADVSANVAVNGAASTGKKDRAWGVDLVPANSAGPAQGTATVYAAIPGGSGGADKLKTDSRAWFIPALSQSFSYDADGNLTGDGVWTYTYNAENQLVRMASVLPAGFTGRHLRLDFKYDWQGRRVEKRVYDNDTSTETSARRYLYDGANLIAESDTAGNLQRTFTWGLDLAGSLSATGGVGALLQIDDLVAGKTMSATYDGNGNLAALVNSVTGALEAAYEYDPSGNLLRCEGAYAKSNPFRFSTKWQDDETGLINYGFRYYSPTLGRFVNRDPIGEKGGLNLYGFCGNDGVNHWDYLGQSWLSHFFSQVGNFVKKYWKPIVAVVAGIVTGGLAYAYSPLFLGAAATVGVNAAIFGAAVGGFVGGATGAALNGGSARDILKAGLVGGVLGGISGGILAKLGTFEGFSTQMKFSTYLRKLGEATSVGAVASGTSAELYGRSFWDGFEKGAGWSAGSFVFTAGLETYLTEKGDTFFPEGGSRNTADYDHITANGVMGNRATFQQLVNRQSIPTLGHFNPSQGIINDTMQSLFQKVLFGWGDSLAADFRSLAAQMKPGPLTIMAHSQATLTVTNAILQGGIPSGSTLNLLSPAISYPRAWLAGQINGGTMHYLQPWGDAANLWSPSLNPLKLLSGTIDIFDGAKIHTGNYQ